MSRSLAVALVLCVCFPLFTSAQEADPRERVRRRVQNLVQERMTELRAELTEMIEREMNAGRPAGKVAELEKAVADLRGAVDRLAREVHALGGHEHGEAPAPVAGRGGWLGVDLAELDGGEKGAHGAHVIRVLPGGPADQAGLEAGDVIVGVAGMPVKSVREVSARASSFAPGMAILVKARRGPFVLDLVATLAPRPDERTLAKLRAQAAAEPEAVPVKAAKGGKGWMGVKMADLPGEAHGAHVLEVQEGTPAERAGLQSGDVIVSVAGMPIETVKQAVERTSSFAPGTTIVVGVRRGPFDLTLVMTLGARPKEGKK